MVTFDFPNATTPDGALIGLSSSIPALPIGILVFSWLMIFLRGTMKQNQRFGYADVPQWATLSSLAVFLLALIMTVVEGIITLPILIITLSLTILTGIWFFLSRGRYE